MRFKDSTNIAIQISLIIGALILVALTYFHFIYDSSIILSLGLLVICILISYWIIQAYVERYIYDHIKVIYKLIHNSVTETLKWGGVLEINFLTLTPLQCPKYTWILLECSTLFIHVNCVSLFYFNFNCSSQSYYRYLGKLKSLLLCSSRCLSVCLLGRNCTVLSSLFTLYL